MLGEYAQAEQFFRQSLEIRRQLGDKAGEGSTLNGLGSVYSLLGEYAQAEQFFRQSLEIRRQLGDKAGEGSTLNGLGSVYSLLGEYAQAEQFFRQSLEIYRQLGDKAGEGNTLNNLGNIYSLLGRVRPSGAILPPIFRNIPTTQGQSRGKQSPQQTRKCLLFAGRVRPSGAILPPILRNIPANRGQSRRRQTLNNLGMAYRYLGEYAQAEQFYRQSLEISRQIGDKAAEGITLNNLGKAYHFLGEYAQAEEYYRQSIEVREQLRPGLTDEQKISLFEQQKSTYEFLQTVLIAQNKLDAALEISERGRGRAFVELLAERLSDNRETPVTVTPPNLREIQQIAAAQQATIVQYSYIGEAFSFSNRQLLDGIGTVYLGDSTHWRNHVPAHGPQTFMARAR